MPIIEIREIDRTTPYGATSQSVVFIPGNVSNTEFTDFNKIIEINSLKKFNSLIGDTIPTYTESSDIAPYTKVGGTVEDPTYTTYDPGYMLAKTAVSKGMTVLYYAPGNSGVAYTSFSAIKSAIETALTITVSGGVETDSALIQDLKDKRKYNITLLSNGGYSSVDKPSTTIVVPESIKGLMDVANVRGDCTFLADHTYDLSSNSDILSYASAVDTCLNGTIDGLSGKYGAMFTPWCYYNVANGLTNEYILLPASLAYLDAFATSQKAGNPTYYAVAGRARGNISGTPSRYLGDKDVEVLSVEENGVAVNPITNVSPYGVLVWGNRTLFKNEDGLVASSFLNIRQLCSTLSKTLYTSSLAYMFEQNSDRLWINFKSDITKVLDDMKQNLGIKGYKLFKLTPDTRAQIKALIRVIPTEAVEKFDLTIELVDGEIELSL